MINYIALELFLPQGEYFVLNSFKYYNSNIDKNNIINVKYILEEHELEPITIKELNKRGIISSYHLYITKKIFCMGSLYESWSDFYGWESVAILINALLPNVKKLSSDELMIRYIIE